MRGVIYIWYPKARHCNYCERRKKKMKGPKSETNIFGASGVQLAQSHRGQFHYRRAAFSSEA
jgi:hypothetical protein